MKPLPSRWIALVLLFLVTARCVPLNAAGDEHGAPRPQIALLHMQNDAWFFQRLGNLTLANKRRYAARWGYDVVSVTPYGSRGVFRDGQEDTRYDIDHSRAPTFGKIKLALQACTTRPNWWLLWSDADAMVVNQSVPLESIIDDGYDLMYAYDWLMLNAGMLLIKCTPWTEQFLTTVYNARKFDKARALDQSAFQSHLDDLKKHHVAEFASHVKVVPKYAMNVYLEEYRPGDFLMHMAGKLYEATEPGLWAIAQQFDVLSTVDDVNDIKAFFATRFLLNYYSGTCDRRNGPNQCPTDDGRRIRLKEALDRMSTPKRYRHVALRYYFFPKGWNDPYDIPGWNIKKKQLPTPVDSHKSEAQAFKEELQELERRKAAPKPPVHDKVQDPVPPVHHLVEPPHAAKRPPEFELDPADDDDTDSPLDENVKQTKNTGAEDEPVTLDSVKKALAHNDKEPSDSEEEEEAEVGQGWLRKLGAWVIGVLVCVLAVMLYRKRRRAIKVQ